MNIFAKERQAIVEATAAAKDGIDLALIVSCAALLLASVAIAYVVVKENNRV